MHLYSLHPELTLLYFPFSLSISFQSKQTINTCYNIAKCLLYCENSNKILLPVGKHMHLI